MIINYWHVLKSHVPDGPFLCWTSPFLNLHLEFHTFFQSSAYSCMIFLDISNKEPYHYLKSSNLKLPGLSQLPRHAPLTIFHISLNGFTIPSLNLVQNFRRTSSPPCLYPCHLPPLAHTAGCGHFQFCFCKDSNQSSPLQSHYSLAWGVAKSS